MVSQVDCIFCKIAQTAPENLPEYDQPIMETANFFVVSAKGQFTEGYVLICPRQHIDSFGFLNSVLFEEFLGIKKKVYSLLMGEYKCRPVFFEHGAIASKKGGSCIEHAHIHVLPVELTSTSPWMPKNLTGGRTEDITSIFEFVKAGRPYFYLECSDGTVYLYDSTMLPCQYGRQVFARILKMNYSDSRWDWRIFPFKERMVKTTRRLRKRIQHT